MGSWFEDKKSKPFFVWGATHVFPSSRCLMRCLICVAFFLFLVATIAVRAMPCTVVAVGVACLGWCMLQFRVNIPPLPPPSAAGAKFTSRRPFHPSVHPSTTTAANTGEGRGEVRHEHAGVRPPTRQVTRMRERREREEMMLAFDDALNGCRLAVRCIHV